jgi:hypothetical protein
VAAGLLWAFAAALAVGAQFGEIYREPWGDGSADLLITTFWWSRSIIAGQVFNTLAPAGVSALVASAVLAAASLLVFASRRRWGATVVGALGVGMMLDEAVSYTSAGIGKGLASLGLGWWLIVGAGVVAVAGFAVALTERTDRSAGPQPIAAPFPSPQPPWPPQQPPIYGAPAQPQFPPAPPTG